MIRAAIDSMRVKMTPPPGIKMTRSNTVGRELMGLVLVVDNPRPKQSRKKYRARLRLVSAA